MPKEEVATEFHLTPSEPYTTDREPTTMAKKTVTSRIQSFLTFITHEMLCNIYESAVEHAREKGEHSSMALPELMAFIAVVILRGVVELPSLH